MPRLHVVLANPEIPPNTGNVARLCGATRSVLHLVHPLGFSVEDRYLKRAGLDYWGHIEVHHHESLDSALAASGEGPVLYFSARAERPYTQAQYGDGSRLVFGPETRGLPAELLEANRDRTFRIPIWGQVRSLNLSAAVAVVVYEGYRRLGAW
ncbi:MAG: tRNA (cytidine(34)-2'-O)-methyltransferase [Deltaproteobacteria bacterium]|nr:tRNA (cytidine(34)-2'-O)-methyltransferase [Deltaproteobacteria bacterium]